MRAPKTRQGIVRKPKQSRSKATVAAIVEAAARILAERGWAGFNTNAVAERAGVSIGSLYEYFPDKQALVDKIASDHLARGEAFFASAADGLVAADDIEALLDALIRGLVELHRDDPRLHRALSSEVPLSPEIEGQVRQLRQGAIALVSQALSRHVDMPGVAAQLLVDTADAVIHRWFVDDDGGLASPERMIEELRWMLWAYISSSAGPR